MAVQARIGDTLLIDPSRDEEQKQQATLVMSMMPALGEITNISCKGTWEGDSLKQAINIGIEGCRQMEGAVRSMLVTE